MRKLIYNTSGSTSEILIGSAWDAVMEKIIPGETVIVTDDNIKRLYGDKFPDCPIITIPPGEKEKTLATVEKIITNMLDLEVDRSYFLLGIGGGVVCDIAGFVASIYMRGINFGFISTSLLSQIDASTGGKNGVNIGSYKNISGVFNQPEFVICDPLLLKTLSPEEYLSGLGELVKYALIKDSKLFDTIEQNTGLILQRDAAFMSKLIEISVNIKIGVVERDERENGERRLLNFGHTVGHAIEISSGLKHGMAISCGMQIASAMSVEEGLLHESDHQRIVALLDKLGLISDCPKLTTSIIDLVKRDKKREKKIIHFILLQGIGHGVIRAISVNELLKHLNQN